MKKDNKHIGALLPAYLDGVLGEKEKAHVASHLKDCQTCSEELERFQSLFGVIEKEVEIRPSDTIRNNFFKALEKEKLADDKLISMNTLAKNQWPTNFLKIASSITLLFGAFFMGKYQQKFNGDLASLETETLEIKQTAMLSLIESQSANKRIQGVNFIEEFNNPDESIINALTNRMLSDQNTNVRLSAVDALSRFAKSETVKSAFIEALATEKNPSVQIAIIENLVRIQEKKAIKPMKKLLNLEDTQPFVKEEIERVLPQII